MERTIWHDCYRTGWQCLIVPEAFRHPAKFARCLIERIYAHGFEQGWWAKKDLIADPFGGVGCGGVIAAYAGLAWVGVELEKRFVALAKQNFEHHALRWEAPALIPPRIILGDSRRFSEILGEAAGIVTSPPYADTVSGRHGKTGVPHPDGRQRAMDGTRSYADVSHGQIGSLPPGDAPRQTVGGIVTSPPYADTESTRAGGARTPHPDGRQRAMDGTHSYADESPGQIGSLPPGGVPGQTVGGIVTSPPWEKGCEGSIRADKFKDPEKFAEEMSKRKWEGAKSASAAARRAQFERDSQKVYGESDGQIGQDSGETYWTAMTAVYQECWKVLPPGGILAVVMKDYVRDKARVPLCDQTSMLLEHVGFKPVERIHAMLVEESVEAGLFGEIRKRVERKSFFRRLAEKKGSPRIDWEEVLVFRR